MATIAHKYACFFSPKPWLMLASDLSITGFRLSLFDRAKALLSKTSVFFASLLV
ncbi:hypothetical protein D039_3780 [Vibrio parahaemolyticus EKP-028]|nr:hypothetical protein D039_3780 [Vibrio parahaemolyticus EKP-028]